MHICFLDIPQHAKSSNHVRKQCTDGLAYRTKWFISDIDPTCTRTQFQISLSWYVWVWQCVCLLMQSSVRYEYKWNTRICVNGFHNLKAIGIWKPLSCCEFDIMAQSMKRGTAIVSGAVISRPIYHDDISSRYIAVNYNGKTLALFTNDTPYLTLTDDLWSVFRGMFKENWPRHIESTLYRVQHRRYWSRTWLRSCSHKTHHRARPPEWAADYKLWGIWSARWLRYKHTVLWLWYVI